MIKDLQQHAEKLMTEQNNRPILDFEGYSPNEMRYIIHDTFEQNSPVSLQKLTDTEYKTIPFLNQVKYLTNLIAQKGELKLTKKGFLPTKIVADIYSQEFIKDELIESGIQKLYKETDSMTINLTRILIEISGIAKKRYNKLSLTKKGEKIISDNFKLLHLIFKTFGAKFNWAYYDGYGDNGVAQLGFGFSLILLSKYGFEKRLDKFYSEKYFNALQINDNLDPFPYTDNNKQCNSCYSLRTFDRFLVYFGLIKIESEKKWDADKYITNTKLYDKLIKCTPPKYLMML